MDKNKLAKKIIVAGLVFSASSMLVACAYGPQPVHDYYPPQQITQTDLQDLGIEDVSVEENNF